MGYSAIDQDVLSKYILRKLGGGVVNVELTGDQLQDAINDALSKYTFYKPKMTWITIPVVPSQFHWVVPNNINCRMVIEVNTDIVVPNIQQIEFNYPFYQRLVTLSNVSEWIRIENWLKQANRALSAHFDWIFDRDGQVLYMANIPGSVAQVSVTYLTDRLITEIYQADEQDFKKLSTAYAKQTLGEIRRKFGKIPGPTGDVTLDGQQLIDEAEKDMEDVIERLKASAYIIPFQWDSDDRN